MQGRRIKLKPTATIAALLGVTTLIALVSFATIFLMSHLVCISNNIKLPATIAQGLGSGLGAYLAMRKFVLENRSTDTTVADNWIVALIITGLFIGGFTVAYFFPEENKWVSRTITLSMMVPTTIFYRFRKFFFNSRY